MTKQTLTVYGGTGCSTCTQACQQLDKHGISYTYINAYEDDEALEFLVENKLRGIPQVFIGDDHIGGYQELLVWLKAQPIKRIL